MNISQQLRALNTDGSISLAKSISVDLLRHNEKALGFISQTAAAASKLTLPLLVHAHYIRSTFDWVVSQILKQAGNQAEPWNLVVALLVGSDDGMKSALASVPSNILISMATACNQSVKLPPMQRTALLESIDQCLRCLLQLAPFPESSSSLPLSFRPNMDHCISLLSSLLDLSVSSNIHQPLSSILEATVTALLPIIRGHPSPKKVFQAFVPRLYLSMASFCFPEGPTLSSLLQFDQSDIREISPSSTGIHHPDNDKTVEIRVRLLDLMELVLMNESHIKGISESAAVFVTNAGFFGVQIASDKTLAEVKASDEGNRPSGKKLKKKRKADEVKQEDAGQEGLAGGEDKAWSFFQGALFKLIDDSASLPAMATLPWLLSIFCKAAVKHRKQVTLQEAIASSIHRKKKAKVKEDQGASSAVVSNQERDRAFSKTAEFEFSLALLSILLKKRPEPAFFSKSALGLSAVLQSVKETGAYRPTLDPSGSQLEALKTTFNLLISGYQEAVSEGLIVSLTATLCSLLDVDHRIIQSQLELVWSLVWKAAESEGGLDVAVAACIRLVSAYKELRQLDFLVESLFDSLTSSSSTKAALAVSQSFFLKHLSEAVSQAYSGQSSSFVALIMKKAGSLASSPAIDDVILALSGVLSVCLASIKIDLMTSVPVASAAKTLIETMEPTLTPLLLSATSSDVDSSAAEARQAKRRRGEDLKGETKVGTKVNWSLLAALLQIHLAAFRLYRHCALMHPDVKPLEDRQSSSLAPLTRSSFIWIGSAQGEVSAVASKLGLVIIRILLMRLSVLYEQAVRLSNTSETLENGSELLHAAKAESKELTSLLMTHLRSESIDLRILFIARVESWGALSSWINASDPEDLKDLIRVEIELHHLNPSLSTLPFWITRPEVLSQRLIGQCLLQALIARLSTLLPLRKESSPLQECLKSLASGSSKLIDLPSIAELESQSATLLDPPKARQTQSSGAVTRRGALKNQSMLLDATCELKSEDLKDLCSTLSIMKSLRLSYLSPDDLLCLSSSVLLLLSFLLDRILAGSSELLLPYLEETLNLAVSMQETIHRASFLYKSTKSKSKRSSSVSAGPSDMKPSEELHVAHKLVLWSSSVLRCLTAQFPSSPSAIEASARLHRYLVRSELRLALDHSDASTFKCLSETTKPQLINEIQSVAPRASSLLLAALVSELSKIESIAHPLIHEAHPLIHEARTAAIHASGPVEETVKTMDPSDDSVPSLLEVLGCSFSTLHGAQCPKWASLKQLLLITKTVILSASATIPQTSRALSFIETSCNNIKSWPSASSETSWMHSFLLEILQSLPSSHSPILPPTSVMGLAAMDLKEPRSIEIRIRVLKSFMALLQCDRSQLGDILSSLSDGIDSTRMEGSELSLILPSLHCLLITLESSAPGSSVLSVVASCADSLSTRLAALISFLSHQPLVDPATAASLCCACRCLESLCGREASFHLSTPSIIQAASVSAGLFPLLFTLAPQSHGLSKLAEEDAEKPPLEPALDWKARSVVLISASSLLACLLRHRSSHLTRSISVIVHAARGMLQSIVEWVSRGKGRESIEFAHAIKRSVGGVVRIYEGVSGLGVDKKESPSSKRASALLSKHCAFLLLDCIWILGSSRSGSATLPAFVLDEIKPGVFFLLTRLEKEPGLMQHIHAVLGSGEGGARRVMLTAMKAEWEKTKHSGKI